MEEVVGERATPGLAGRIADGVCRRAFSSPEATAYELTIAPALAEALEPALRPCLRGARLIDIGCGGGQIAKRLAHSGFSVVGIDPSRAQVRRFARAGGLGTRPAQARAEALPFPSESFESLYSSCAWKHWPMPHLGIAECVRVTRSGGSLAVIEIDGTASADEFWAFARTSRIPLGLRRAYLRFAMRTVVGVAPTRDEFARSFDGLPLVGLDVSRIEGLPFLLATANVV
ncbi:MAG TPA: class I SAM-dependent methyltransferase [Acidimicrobiales bacterium]|nr:class I SAM-dependent methyltransferase [Acidimicrobiales bacterium]